MSSLPAKLCVHAVVVTYLPDIQALRKLLVALAAQVAGVQIVDNTPQADARVPALLDELAFGNVHLLRLGENLGIARALNDGIAAAITTGATHVLLSDQDSLPTPDMVASLLRAERELAAKGVHVGAVGPTFTDGHTGITFPFQVDVPGKFFYGHARTNAEWPLVEALTLITSGCLIPAAAWAVVGPMREDFFIDHVDIEWSHRARAAGLKLYGTGWATMAHRMGDAQLRVWYFGWHRESAYSPLRVYYRMRNFVALCKQDNIPARWKLRNSIYWIKFVYAHVVFGSAKLQAMRMILRGLRDGFCGRMGRYPDNQFTRGKP